MTTQTTARRPARATALAAVALGALLGLAPVLSPLGGEAAFAHDELIASSPEPGQVLETAPAEVKLTFSDDIIPVGTAIEVVDHHGETIDSGEAVVAGPDVSATLPAGLEGEYQVRWRAVSSDGHVIDGTIDFGVGAGATGVWTEEAPHGDSGAGSGSSGEQLDGHDDSAEASDGPDGWAIAGIVLGVVGVAALGAAVAVLVTAARKRTPKA